MPVPLDITFRNLDASPAVASRIRTLMGRLSRVYPNIISSRAVVELQSRRHQHGNLYKVNLDVRVPNAELVVGQHAGAHPGHEDVYVAVRDAFDQMRRKLSAHVQQRQGRSLGRAEGPIKVAEQVI